MSWLSPVSHNQHSQNQSQAQSQPQSQPSNISQTDSSQPRRIHQIIRLKPEHYEDYKKCHAEVWPEVKEQIRRSGIRDYSISYDSSTFLLFASFKYIGTDFDADMSSMRSHEPTRRWWAMTDGYQSSLNEGALGSEKAGTRGKDGKIVPQWWRGCEEVFYQE